MCGIYGYIRHRATRESVDPVDVCLEGLSLLEYRGYDSAGIAGIIDGKIKSCKRPGNVRFLKLAVNQEKLRLDTAIAHTRWATHGVPNEENAHPHLDEKKTLAVVHNGIIENHTAIRSRLQQLGVVFQSDTDSEVIAQLISYLYEKDLRLAVRQALKQLQGSLAIAVIHVHYPKQIIAASRESPLVIGIDKKRGRSYISSDVNALMGKSIRVFYLGDDEIVILDRANVRVYDAWGSEVNQQTKVIEANTDQISKKGYEHFMLKEIVEQSHTIEQAMHGRIDEERGTAIFKGLAFEKEYFRSVNQMVILGCGSSWHASYIAASFFENFARIPTKVEIASEFRYANPIISKNTLLVAMSQSGETADTIAAIRLAKAKGAKVIGICNVYHSTLARESHSCLFLNAGPEISVCSTKAFTSQLTVLALFALFIARIHHLDRNQGQCFLKQLNQIPIAVRQVLSRWDAIERFAKKYARYEHFFFLGRRYMFPTSLEAALKLKEISYLNATGYPAGEIKHGPLALVNPNLAVIGMCGDLQTIDKMLSNLTEVKARGGNILAFCPSETEGIEKITSDILYLPKATDFLASILYSVAGQIFAYGIAKQRGTEIDQPRNLAKSVTVE